MKENRNLESEILSSQSSVKSQEHLLREYEVDLEKLRQQVQLDQDVVARMEAECNEVREVNLMQSEQIAKKDSQIKTIRAKYKEIKATKREFESRVESLLK